MEGWWAASYAVLWALVLVLCVVVVALARQIGTLHLRLGPRGALEMDDEGPPLGQSPPHADVVAMDGSPLTIGGPSPARVLMFVSPGCLVCEQVLPALPVLARTSKLEAIVVTDVDEAETKTAFGSKGLGLPVVSSREVMQSYQVPGTPYVVVMDDRGLVRGKGTVNNLEQMEGLIETALRRSREAGAERQAS